jgi:hypothetical protein
MILMVIYDLEEPIGNNDNIEAILKSATSWVHPRSSVWLLDSLDAPAMWRNRIRELVDPCDEVLVMRISPDWVSFNTNDEVVNWLGDNSRSW